MRVLYILTRGEHMEIKTAVRTISVCAVKLYDEKSDPSKRKWYAASTLEILKECLGGEELCWGAVAMSISFINGCYRIRDGDIDRPVHFFR